MEGEGKEGIKQRNGASERASKGATVRGKEEASERRKGEGREGTSERAREREREGGRERTRAEERGRGGGRSRKRERGRERGTGRQEVGRERASEIEGGMRRERRGGEREKERANEQGSKGGREGGRRKKEGERETQGKRQFSVRESERASERDRRRGRELGCGGGRVGWGGVVVAGCLTEDEDHAGGDGGGAPLVERPLGDEGLLHRRPVDVQLPVPHRHLVPSHRHCPPAPVTHTPPLLRPSACSARHHTRFAFSPSEQYKDTDALDEVLIRLA